MRHAGEEETPPGSAPSRLHSPLHSAVIPTLLSFGAWRSLKPFQTCGALRTREPWLPFDDVVWTRGARGTRKTCGNQGSHWSISQSTFRAETASDMKPHQTQRFSKGESPSKPRGTRPSRRDTRASARLYYLT